MEKSKSKPQNFGQVNYNLIILYGNKDKYHIFATEKKKCFDFQELAFLIQKSVPQAVINQKITTLLNIIGSVVYFILNFIPIQVNQMAELEPC